MSANTAAGQSTSSSRPPVKVAVVGAGIIGLSTALRILQTLPPSAAGGVEEVAVFAERTSPGTTSDVAGGFWCPSYLSETPEEVVIPWAEETYNFLVQLAKSSSTSGSASTCGVFLSPGFELYSVEKPVARYWSHIPIGFRPASQQELALFPSRYKSGVFYISPIAEGSKFLPCLAAQFAALGGKLMPNRRVESFSELHQLGYRYIVNCSGLGAIKLCNDKAMYPIRGQVHRVRAPWLKFWFDCDDGTYCLLNSQFAVLGGVAEPNNWDTSVSEQDKAAILARNYAVWPPLREAPVEADLVGLRPARDRVRLEREVVRDAEGAAQFTIYHNYGHGGSGLTLFWGCAGSVVNLLAEDLHVRPRDHILVGRL